MRGNSGSVDAGIFTRVQLLEGTVLVATRLTMIITNRGTSFTSKSIISFLNSAGVDLNISPAFHPQSNGLTERTNETLLSRLRPFVCSSDEGHADWDVHLLSTTFAINTAVHSSTDTTPYEIVYGQLPILPVMADVQTPLTNGTVNTRQRIHRLRNKVARNIRNAQTHQRRYYDLRHIEAPQFAQSDEVWVRKEMNPTRGGGKLHNKYVGPYQAKAPFGSVQFQAYYSVAEITLQCTLLP